MKGKSSRRSNNTNNIEGPDGGGALGCFGACMGPSSFGSKK